MSKTEKKNKWPQEEITMYLKHDDTSWILTTIGGNVSCLVQQIVICRVDLE